MTNRKPRKNLSEQSNRPPRKTQPRALQRQDQAGYIPTPHEINVKDEWAAYHASNHSPRVKVSRSGNNSEYSLDHPHRLFADLTAMKAVGTKDENFLNGLLTQLANVNRDQDGQINQEQMNFAFAIVKGSHPRDEIEALHAMQLGFVHSALVKTTQLLLAAENIPQMDSAGRLVDRLTRTYTAGMETLKRNHSGSDQKVPLQQAIHISGGSQAIVSQSLTGDCAFPKTDPNNISAREPLLQITIVPEITVSDSPKAGRFFDTSEEDDFDLEDSMTRKGWSEHE